MFFFVFIEFFFLFRPNSYSRYVINMKQDNVLAKNA